MAICDLLELRFLDLSDNMIDELPASIARLQGLQSLLLVYNRLTRLPDSICDMVRRSILLTVQTQAVTNVVFETV